MNVSYDVIIAGAGPAGSTLAYQLSKNGVDTLLIEKKALPRYKCCAGGVTFRAAQLLPVNVPGMAEDIINRADISYKGDLRYSGVWNKDLIYTVMRDRFDEALVRKAQETGTTVLSGHPVRLIENGTNGVKVKSGNDVFSARFLVGADGSNSVIARRSGLNTNMDYIAGVNTELSVSKEELRRWRNRILVDVGGITGGYAWVFPKADHLTVGLASILSKKRSVNGHYHGFLESINLSHARVLRRSGGMISLCKKEPRLWNNRVVLVGDSAGLADPFTGEGIYNAVQSALMLEPVIRDCLSKEKLDFNEYQRTVHQNLMPEIKMSRGLQKIFIRFPELVARALNTDPRVWRGCCYMVRGEIDYIAGKQKIGGYKGISSLLLMSLTRRKRVLD